MRDRLFENCLRLGFSSRCFGDGFLRPLFGLFARFFGCRSGGGFGYPFLGRCVALSLGQFFRSLGLAGGCNRMIIAGVLFSLFPGRSRLANKGCRFGTYSRLALLSMPRMCLGGLVLVESKGCCRLSLLLLFGSLGRRSCRCLCGRMDRCWCHCRRRRKGNSLCGQHQVCRKEDRNHQDGGPAHFCFLSRHDIVRRVEKVLHTVE